MPQMSPYNWLTHNIMFNMIMLYLITNFHYFNYNNLFKKLPEIKTIKFNLMW